MIIVINDFFDTYVKYKYIFKSFLIKLRYYHNLSNNKINKDNDEKDVNKKDIIKTNPLILINSNNYRKKTHDLFLKKSINNNNILTTKNSTKDKEKILIDSSTENNNNMEKAENDSEEIEDNKKELYQKDIIIKEEKQKEKGNISELKFILFNLPGQSTTLFSKKVIQNNIYYSDFLDRFIYYLYKEKVFDLSYKIILLGFGNGGHVALTYASLYEKYWNVLESIIMFNSYCKNGPIVNETMVELLRLVTKENNPKTIEFFIEQSTRNPNEG